MNINDIVNGLKNFKFENSYTKYNNNKKSIIGGGIYTSETSANSEYLEPSKNNVAASDTSFDTVANISTEDSETSIDSTYLEQVQNNVAISDTSVESNSNNLFLKNNIDGQIVIDSDVNFVKDILFNGENIETVKDKVLKKKYSIDNESVEKLLKLI